MKKGISLIVLVITIIVMIIIAGAIILSLSNGNVIAKGNLGRLVGDRAAIQDLAVSRMNEFAVLNEGATYTNYFADLSTLTTPYVAVPGFTAVPSTTLQYGTSGAKGTWALTASTTTVILKLPSGTLTKAAARTLLGLSSTETLPEWVYQNDGVTLPTGS